MDARKIQFLIGMQREIDNLEKRDGNTPKVERVKSRFYDVVEVDKIVKEPPVANLAATPNSQNQALGKSEADSNDNEEWIKFIEDFNDDIDDYTINAEAAAEIIENGLFLNSNAPSASSDIGTKGSKTSTKGNQSQGNFPHRPKDVADFMKLFDNAQDLKYLTHDFDESDQKFDIVSFLAQAKDKFDLYTSKYIIPKSLWVVINQFAFSEKPMWSALDQKVEEGWSSPKWITWAEKEGYPTKNLDFNSIVVLFKDLTRVRSLPKIINSVIEKKFKDQQQLFNFKFIGLEKADFYTHVGRFKTAVEHLFDEICRRDDCLNITIEFERKAIGEYRQRIIHIHHHDSYPSNKPLQEVLDKYRQSGGHLWEVREKLFGYCDWYIETIWDDQPVRVHLLSEGMKANDIDVVVEKIDSISRTGFTHTLTFYFR